MVGILTLLELFEFCLQLSTEIAQFHLAFHVLLRLLWLLLCSLTTVILAVMFLTRGLGVITGFLLVFFFVLIIIARLVTLFVSLLRFVTVCFFGFVFVFVLGIAFRIDTTGSSTILLIRGGSRFLVIILSFVASLTEEEKHSDIRCGNCCQWRRNQHPCTLR
eukprot:TRINITY_DN4117_c0_g1_i1.p1 TRINITY_DN4117_c0_g1~~TRINITY_DN4117_c0_g1_i1.p1  ORF type:complete len:162 (+),score=11.54 TRINITY_DN4117_c0_g1_i1:852-1337(+)